jgi:uncharacterized protein with von Willebrand factor type A (vWA) domain
VGTGRLLSFARALSAVDARRRDDVYWAGRSTMVSKRDDVAVYDAAFSLFWDRLQASGLPGTSGPAAPPGPEAEKRQALATVEASGEQVVHVDPPDLLGEEPAEDAGGDDEPAAGDVWSPIEVLREKDFSEYEAEEYLVARRLMTRLRAAPPMRPSRRPRPSHRGRLDLRRTLRSSLRTAGVPIERQFRRRGTRPRRIVLIADVSGSMERYSRALLQFLHAAVAGGRHVEAFVFGTRLTRVTKELRSVDPDRALREAARAVVDWGGGTRIGEAIGTFNDRWGQRGMARGAIVVILSDGWERGGSDVLGREMERLHRLAHRIIWVNPLKAAAGYAPLAAGMAAALPHVDDFVTGHNLASLEAVCSLLEGTVG